MYNQHPAEGSERLKQALLLNLEEDQNSFEEHLRQNGPHAFPADFKEQILLRNRKKHRERFSIPALSGCIAAAVLLLFLLSVPFERLKEQRSESITLEESAPEPESDSFSAEEEIPLHTEPQAMESESYEEDAAVLSDDLLTAPAEAPVRFEKDALVLTLEKDFSVSQDAPLYLVRENDPENHLSETVWDGSDRLSFPLKEAPAQGGYRIIGENETLLTFEWSGMADP